MYQVIKMKGDNEPWWFFEDWTEDVETTQEFSQFDEAFSAYQQLYRELAARYERSKTKKTYLVAFWNPGEVAFCEDCDEDLQQYHGLLLLKEGQVMEELPEGLLNTSQKQPLQRKGCLMRKGKENR